MHEILLRSPDAQIRLQRSRKSLRPSNCLAHLNNNLSIEL
jgi:hypothetical protein